MAIGIAQRHGATAADALFINGQSTEIKVRLGEVEQVKQSRSHGLGIRVFFGQRSATTSTSDLSAEGLESLIARTCASGRVTAEDEYAGLPPLEDFTASPVSGLDLYDPQIEALEVEDAIKMATQTEAIATRSDPRIVNSEGAEMSWGSRELTLMTTGGTLRTQRSGSLGLWTTPVAEQDGTMERDYWYSSARHLADLDPPERIGNEAARRTLRRLGARKPETCHVPVIFEWTMASRLLGALAGALNGGAIYRKTSYLCDRLGEEIAHPSVQIVDDPHVVRGSGSRAFDGEGLATGPIQIITDGRLNSYLLDTYTGRKLGLATTRSASRGLAGTPSPTTSNFWMAPGEHSLADLIGGVSSGLLVTELFGFGVNTVTGDYSQGASGLWIEDGAIAYPVNEFTIASTLPDIWTGIDGIANDRDPNRAVSAPSFRVAQMTVAGN